MPKLDLRLSIRLVQVARCHVVRSTSQASEQTKLVAAEEEDAVGGVQATQQGQRLC
jgi:hypothetical protein